MQLQSAKHIFKKKKETYSVKVELNDLGGEQTETGPLYTRVGMDVNQRDFSSKYSKDVESEVSVVQLCDLSLGLGLEMRAAWQQDSKGGAVVGDSRQSIDHCCGCSATKEMRAKISSVRCVGRWEGR
jgi:hypothetical protein